MLRSLCNLFSPHESKCASLLVFSFCFVSPFCYVAIFGNMRLFYFCKKYICFNLLICCCYCCLRTPAISGHSCVKLVSSLSISRVQTNIKIYVQT